jgi:hypothetical protein
MNPSRRQFIVVSSALAATALAPRLLAQQPDAAPGVRKPPPKPPVLTPEKVQAVVGQAHRSLDGVRALVEEIPLLVNACWDQGGGDFETPLEAAAHTGRREIAEYLLARHARPNLFASAMLGQLDTIKAAFAMNPKVYEVPGPHGFTLLHCAKQGGAPAKAVYDFLIAQGSPATLQLPLPYIWPAGTKPAQ